MWSLKKTAAECKGWLLEEGLPLGEIVEYRTFHSANFATFGVLRKSQEGFIVSVHSRLLSEDIPRTSLQSVLLGEMIRTCPGCQGAGNKWDKYRIQIQEKYGIEIYREPKPGDLEIPVIPEMNKKEGLELPPIPIKVGDQIKHYDYGKGVVTGIRRIGTDALVTFDFERCGEIQLMLKLAATKIKLVRKKEENTD